MLQIYEKIVLYSLKKFLIRLFELFQLAKNDEVALQKKKGGNEHKAKVVYQKIIRNEERYNWNPCFKG